MRRAPAPSTASASTARTHAAERRILRSPRRPVARAVIRNAWVTPVGREPRRYERASSSPRPIQNRAEPHRLASCRKAASRPPDEPRFAVACLALWKSESPLRPRAPLMGPGPGVCQQQRMNEGTRQRSRDSEERARESGEGGPLPTEEESRARKRSSARSGRDAARAKRRGESRKGTGTPASSPRAERRGAGKRAGDVKGERSKNETPRKTKGSSRRSPSASSGGVRRSKRSGSKSNAN